MDDLVLSVYELNSYVSDKLSGDPFLEEIWVRGEVSDVNRRHDTLYFVLKDDAASLGCMLFHCAEALEYADKLVEGYTVLARGEISLYRKTGNYRMVVKEVQLLGLGELYAKFEQVRARLDKLGIFAAERKRRIPPYPEKIGIVTSAQGAAIQDIKNIARRRNPQVKLFLYSAKVQGKEAPNEIIRGISYFNEHTDVDILIVGRGGGSAEDLAAFNDEELVMSVYRSRIPVISAVGHETDFTLCDMAADLRAPTPSAAAELAIPARDDVRSQILNLRDGIYQRITKILFEKKASFKQNCQAIRKDLMTLQIAHAKEIISSKRNMIKNRIIQLYENRRMEYNNFQKAISDLSPMSAFDRGYSVAMHNGRELRSISAVQAGDEIDIILKDGVVKTHVVRSDKNA